MKFLAILTVVNVLTDVTKCDALPRVHIPSLGKIEGSYGVSLKGRTFSKFEGVPYAQPPVGRLRFREPVQLKPWSGVWEAKTVYRCMQNFPYTPPGDNYVLGNEDCLYLNIYTPDLNQSANLDVIVFIHGGGFMFGYGGFQEPQFIQDRDVVFISLNYRLGPLGFLSTEDNVVPGNNGLKDQILALHWIKQNAKYFGGNSDSITIAGMSAGGASVHFHYLSPKSRGLFHRGISQSGTTLCPWVLSESPLEKAKNLAAHLGCRTKNNAKMIKCLRRRPGYQITAFVKLFQPWLYTPFTPFGVVVDSWSDNPVLPEHPYMLLKKKKVADLPWIVSYTASEGLFPTSFFYSEKKYLQDIDTRWNDLLPFILDYNYTVDPRLHDMVSQKIRTHYLGNQRVSRSTFSDFVDIASDRLFIGDIYETARLHAAATKSPVYSYYFTHRGAHSRSELRSKSSRNFGASHGDDTVYAFKAYVDVLSTKDDRAMVDLMVDMFASFAHTGKANITTNWQPVSKNIKDPLVRLKIAGPKKLRMEASILKNAKFWKSLPIMENERLFSNVGEVF
ncbi:venom carboxylesterase-6-like [Tenebrio molitor]|uniref:venom carboxylesterase-6-like n=1 Tax=Tenebrio molitor TaxID=7067 RepID=UPI0036249F24